MNNNLVDVFIKLVQIDSVTGYEKKITDFLVSYLKGMVDIVKKDSYGNVYARIDGEGKPIFFASHMDTVEPGRGIKPKIKKGYIVSDGTTILGADNKVAIAGMLEIARLIKKSKVLHRPVEFLFTLSEEVGNYGAINFDYSMLRSKLGYCFDTSRPVGTIVDASPFYERFDIIIKGKAAHASLPEQANNVLFFLASLLKEVPLGQLDEDTILNIGVLQSGHVRNTIPGELTFKGEIRSFVESSLLHHKEIVLKKIHQLVKKYNMQIVCEFVRENPGYKHTDKESLRAIKNIEKKMSLCGLKPKIESVWGVSDANIFNERGLICFNLGDGTEHPHTTNERISISQLMTLARLMTQLIMP
ncbi:hypothetical protein A2334_01445 [Candidatus Roizmanbacteria bacterium RIFOXYB2_FULL_38_10]|uniref:Peptidase M20 dimerisation domain-containing protein n=1 Tax=Candidatus Roizmanbacteria bacterium RIFOXYD1_FULL_38_12 TaxID=1802093 RepID=A0A1F7L2F5_9BACT|nr:MAG: hypothetical protein A3K47_05615 [Candidatus Roizmanbacteria bacterium RIFOXYA2_FULL_38_14]OGK64221.1 MAG: hypothetical protein A3K27_05615 [Candidatus Roizmanbacteria bacterium RIFOXYA1_FULL_37_12]OGK66067.1 MAG: hypothetical protein A3K38_05615 [Candidatus Roizmanbacteria bacterium RIFOXYB1_FULL_40_23]OGK68514.1 MAG: hypothetical protein A2334_01445 [Candidatus Roizmanbacteria bacterium RIFOXYB2_FULL_38_10]OGK70472.1 MAG: hypothetical protein A3K21_05620 [Candidatus Roizmanbacteria ba